MKKLYTILFLSITCSTIHAQVYSYTDKNGHTIYTDDPPKGQLVKKLDLGSQPINKLEQNTTNTSERNIRRSPQAQQPAEPFRYNLLRITLPEPDAAISNTGGVMTVSIETNPSIRSDHAYQILVDGKIVMSSPDKTVIQLENLERGDHQLAVAIVDKNGKIIEQTPSQPFHIRQTTLSDKRRTNPCQLKDYGVRPECPIGDKPPPESMLRKVTNTLGLTTKAS